MYRALGVTIAATHAALLLTACSPDGGEAAPPGQGPSAGAPREVVVRTADYSFDMPDTLVAGLTTFRLVNEGPDFHHVYLIRLEGGHSLEELATHLTAGGPPPTWAVDVGGPNSPGVPGQETNATLDLKPGVYAVLCVIPGPDGVPHLMKGMSREVVVVPGTAESIAMPAADIRMTLDDYSFQTDVALTPGRHTLRIENAADQPHEVLIVKLEPGRTAAEFVSFVETREGTPPGVIIGGITGIAKGEVNQITLDLTPGEYALLCFVPDASDGAPHVAHGMIRQLRVG